MIDLRLLLCEKGLQLVQARLYWWLAIFSRELLIFTSLGELTAVEERKLTYQAHDHSQLSSQASCVAGRSGRHVNGAPNMLCDLNLRRSNDSSDTNHLQGTCQFITKTGAFAFSHPRVRTTEVIASRHRTASSICKRGLQSPRDRVSISLRRAFTVSSKHLSPRPMYSGERTS